MANADTVSVEQKRAALGLVLQSDTFARADQLKKFLHYVCEMEIAGRGAELTEYLVGVEALGRPREFSPNEDTTVRNRAYALRHKLERFYEEERPSAEIRIEFLKGTYIPRFVVNAPAGERADTAAPGPSSPDSSAPDELDSPVGGVQSTPRGLGGRWRIAASLIGALLAGLVIGAFAMRKADQREFPAIVSAATDPVIREAWGPLLDPQANVLICVATAAQFTVLPLDIKVEWNSPLPTLEVPTALYPWYLRYHRLEPSGKLFLVPDVNSPHFGDVLGAMTIARTLNAAGVPFQFLPERLVPSATLSERNVMLFGVPHKSEGVRKLLASGHYQFKYDPGLRDIFLAENGPNGSSERRFLPARDERSDRIESFGLITVRPSPGVEGGRARSVIFSGDPSAGAAAAAEYFSSPSHMRELRQRFAKQGYAHFPASYQVVIRCRLDSNLPTSVGYVTHAVLNP